MRQVAIGAVILGTALAGAARAQDGADHGWANVDATVNWSKDVVVVEHVSREKAVYIKGTPVLRGAGGGEAAALATVGNTSGEVLVAPTLPMFNGSGGYASVVRTDANIVASVNFNNGIMQVNQDVGLLSNQGNLLSTATADVIGTGSMLGDAQVEIEQYNADGTIERGMGDGAGESVAGVYGTFGVLRKSSLQSSVNANVGILNVNQNAGEMNNQTNGNAVGVGGDGVALLGEAALGQRTVSNTVLTVQNYAASSITDSINNNVAQVSVNQSSGGGNNQSSSFHFSSWLSFSTPGVTATKY